MLLTRSRLGPPVTLKTHKLEPLLESSSFTEQGCERKECSTSPLQPVPQCFIPPAPFSIQIYLLRLDSFPFHPICLSSSSVQNRADIFHISVLALPTSLKASSVPPMTFSEVRFSSLITTSSSCWADTLPAISPWFSCRALWVRIQPDFPSAWCHFIFGCTSCKRKGEKKGGKTHLAETEVRNANWLRWNPSGETRKVCLLISLTTLGRECGRECGSHTKQPALDFRPPLTAFELDMWKGEGHLFV